ncbi:MAG: hypothetical protein MHM6MM_005226 [Cercozoa sp. M6MM]
MRFLLSVLLAAKVAALSPLQGTGPCVDPEVQHMVGTSDDTRISFAPADIHYKTSAGESVNLRVRLDSEYMADPGSTVFRYIIENIDANVAEELREKFLAQFGVDVPDQCLGDLGFLPDFVSANGAIYSADLRYATYYNGDAADPRALHRSQVVPWLSASGGNFTIVEFWLNGRWSISAQEMQLTSKKGAPSDTLDDELVYVGPSCELCTMEATTTTTTPEPTTTTLTYTSAPTTTPYTTKPHTTTTTKPYTTTTTTPYTTTTTKPSTTSTTSDTTTTTAAPYSTATTTPYPTVEPPTDCVEETRKINYLISLLTMTREKVIELENEVAALVTENDELQKKLSECENSSASTTPATSTTTQQTTTTSEPTTTTTEAPTTTPHTSTTEPSTCEPSGNLLQNPSFEEPVLQCEQDNPIVVHVPQQYMPGWWLADAEQDVFQVECYGLVGVESAHGLQHLELNGKGPTAISQAIDTTNYVGDVGYLTFAYRERKSAEPNLIRIIIGSGDEWHVLQNACTIDGVPTAMEHPTYGNGIIEATNSDSWQHVVCHFGIRHAWTSVVVESVSPAEEDSRVGNLLDHFELRAIPPECVPGEPEPTTTTFPADDGQPSTDPVKL